MRQRIGKTKKINMQYIVISLIGILSLIGLMMIISVTWVYFSNSAFEKSSTVSDNKTKNKIYHTIAEIYSNPEAFDGQDIYIAGYMCNEVGVLADNNNGVAWLSNLKLSSKDDEGVYLIRLESAITFDYSPKAVIAFGTFRVDKDTKSLVMDNAKLYNYTGDNVEMLYHNKLIDLNIIEVVTQALTHSVKEPASDKLQAIISVSCDYKDEALEAALLGIKELELKKEELSLDDYNEQAEQLRQEFIESFINTKIMEDKQ